MERFKVVERETKTKAYSKEGLTSGQKLDPVEKERSEISLWLNQSIDSLNLQVDQFEAEIETLGTAKKKKNRNENAEKIEEYQIFLEKHRDHVQKLETLLRMVSNDSVQFQQVQIGYKTSLLIEENSIFVLLIITQDDYVSISCLIDKRYKRGRRLLY